MSEENKKLMNEVSLGRVQGNNVYIKFNYKASMDGASDVYVEGMKYIGIITTPKTPKPTEGYTWIKFVGDDGKSVEPTLASDVVAGLVKLGVANGAAKYDHSHGSITYMTGRLSGSTLILTEQTKEIKGA